MVKKIILLIIAILVLTGCQAQTAQLTTEQFFAMDTLITVTYNYESTKISTTDMAGVFSDLELKLSRTIEDSEISLLNKSAGLSQVELSAETIALIEKAFYYRELTGGAFEPAILPLVEAWNISDLAAPLPTKLEINDAIRVVANTSIDLTSAPDAGYLPYPESGLDLGGIAKGYAADQLMAFLKENGVTHVLISAGGGVQASGGKAEDTPWKIGLQDPINPERGYFATYALNDGAVVTSGDYQRYKEVDGQRYHHIIDSKSGYPAANGIVAATIFTTNSIDADALSTAVFVLGIDEGLALINSLPNTDCLIVTSDKKVIITQGLDQKIVITNKEYQINEIR